MIKFNIFNINLNEFKDPDSKSLPQFYMVKIWHEWPSVSCFHLIISSSFCLHFLCGFLRYICIVDVFLNGQGSCMDIDLRCVCELLVSGGDETICRDYWYLWISFPVIINNLFQLVTWLFLANMPPHKHDLIFILYKYYLLTICSSWN